MGIFDKKLTDEELADELQAQMLGGVPLRPEEVQGLPEGAPTDVPQELVQANQIVEADNAPKDPAPLTPEELATMTTPTTPEMQPVQETPNEEPTPEQSMQQKLWAEYEASKAQEGDRRNQAGMLDAFEQMNRSLAGQAGNKITGGPTNISQLPKKESMEELLAKYKMISGDKDRQLKEKLAEKKAAKPTVFETEQAKADAKESIQIKKENRKMRQEMEKSIPELDEQLKNIKEAKAALKAAKGLAGTGPIDQYASKFTDQGQKLEQALNKISLNTMVKMFSGMSKAIDSDAERKFFQSAQPAMNKYETVNEDILNKMEENVMSLKGKSQEAMKSITPSGEKKEDSSLKPTYGKEVITHGNKNHEVGKLIKAKGKTYKIIDNKGNLEEVK